MHIAWFYVIITSPVYEFMAHIMIMIMIMNISLQTTGKDCPIF